MRPQASPVVSDRGADRVEDVDGDRQHDDRRHPAPRMSDGNRFDRLWPYAYRISHGGSRLAGSYGTQVAPIELLSLIFTSELAIAPSATLQVWRIVL